MADMEEGGALPSLRVARASVTLRQQVLDILRNAILEFRFKPGDRLIEREICELTGVSRTSVREALRHLESEGLVRNLPNKGPIVATVTTEEALQIYEVRRALEGLAGRLFAERATDQQVKALEAALGKLGEAFSGMDRREIVAETNRLYEVMLEGCGNAVIRDLIRSLNARVVFLRATSMSQPGRAPGSLVEMQRIVAAIVRRDPAAAEAACKDHVDRACAAALDVIKRGGVGAVR